MELKDTIDMMNSEDYKERFRAEYFQLNIRMDKLNKVINALTYGKLDFEPDCSINLLTEQFRTMRVLMGILEERAKIEGISLSE